MGIYYLFWKFVIHKTNELDLLVSGLFSTPNLFSLISTPDSLPYISNKKTEIDHTNFTQTLIDYINFTQTIVSFKYLLQWAAESM